MRPPITTYPNITPMYHEYYIITEIKGMDHLTFVSRLRLLISLVPLEAPLAKDARAFLEMSDNSPANAKMKSAAADVLLYSHSLL